ncbi:hypothetical protein [Chitinophaga vietnamensis]|uniref:hypothetical protein n=1 Tax=Chitinophaga vietnamensis TaxID=2593957 RepID=UPI0011789D8F|nr:hypothetical protein [Chitinophaga vietnamensis]
MDNNSEKRYIQACLAMVEQQLNRGSSHDWTTYDFEKLSEEIQEATQVALSVTTLKRLWGKLKYDNAPAVTTLNTIAQFAGYADWRAFKYQHAMPAPASPEKIKIAHRRWPYALLGIIPLLVILYFLVFSGTDPKTAANAASFYFSSNKTVTSGVPNSVIFHYEAHAAADTVFIAQSWDVRRKVAVPRDQQEYSAIYYQPGYFRAKLMVGKQIVKEHDLMITSDGWVALVENNKTEAPLYFRQQEFRHDSGVAVSRATMEAYHLGLQPEAPKLRFINVRDMEGIQNDQFVFETSLKSDFNEGTAACQRVQVLILCKNDVITIPLCAKGCVGEMSLYANGAAASSRSADLSKFGCNMSDWVKLRVEANNRHLRFFVNGVEASALDCPNAPTDIVGLQYRFDGPGAIKDTRFIKGNQVINFQ